jgi:hypothetical protein
LNIKLLLYGHTIASVKFNQSIPNKTLVLGWTRNSKLTEVSNKTTSKGSVMGTLCCFELFPNSQVIFICFSIKNEGIID